MRVFRYAARHTLSFVNTDIERIAEAMSRFQSLPTVVELPQQISSCISAKRAHTVSQQIAALSSQPHFAKLAYRRKL